MLLVIVRAAWRCACSQGGRAEDAESLSACRAWGADSARIGALAPVGGERLASAGSLNRPLQWSCILAAAFCADQVPSPRL